MAESRQAEGPLSVLFDDQAFMLQRRGGVSRYFVALMEQFADPELRVTVKVPHRFTRNEQLAEYDPARFTARPSNLLNHPRVLGWANRLASRESLRTDVIHHTYYFERRLRQQGVPSVVTVYDMTPELFPELFGGSRPHRDKKACVDEAAAVICISEQVHRDLVEIYGEPQAPIFVTPLGVSSQFAVREPAPAGLDEFVLFVGTRSHYKEFTRLVDAMAVLRGRLRPQVLCVGGGEFTHEETRHMELRGVHSQFHQRSLTNAELVGAYQAASAFVFPSLSEGFGLPVLEAFAASCPTVLSDIPVFHEVAGDAAVYFCPGDAESLAEALEAVLLDSELGQALTTRGEARAKQFTWRRTAESTVAAYLAASDVGER